MDLDQNPVGAEASATYYANQNGNFIHPTSEGYALLASAASGAYQDGATYYAAILALLRSTGLGADYVP